MKTFIIFLCIILNTFTQVYSQDEDFTLWKEGKTFIYNTTGHLKSKGLNLSVKFPNNWTALEGNRPNIVQKFYHNNKPFVTALIIVKTFETPPTSEEMIDLQTESQIKTLIPKGGTHIKSNTGLIIDGETAFSIEYKLERKAENNVTGLDFNGYIIIYYIIFKNYLIALQFCVTNDITKQDEDINAKFEEHKLAFKRIVNSVIILSKWQ